MLYGRGNFLNHYRTLTSVHRLIAALLVLGGLLHTGFAQAQRAFYLDRVQVGAAPDDGLTIRRPYLHPKTRVYASSTLGYVLNPLRASTVAVDETVEDKIENLVQHQIIQYFNAGVEIGGRVSLGLSFPVAWMQLTGDVPIEGTRTPLPQIFPVDDGTGMYDVSLTGRVRLFGEEKDSFRVGLGGAIFVPSGTFSRGASDDDTTFYAYLAAEEELGPLLVVASAGPHFRPLRGINGNDSRLNLGNEVRINAAAFLDLHDRFRVGGEINGMVGFDSSEAGTTTFFDGPSTPWEWMGSGRLLFGNDKKTYVRASAGSRMSNGYGAPDLRVMVSIGRWSLLEDLVPTDETRVRFAGSRVRQPAPAPDLDTDSDGYPDAIDACVDLAEDGEEPYPADGCPVTSDRDKDGIVDLDDECPTVAEDRDGILDEDGCPETDADGDGVLDTRDACPQEVGVEHGDPSRDGCPVRKKKNHIVEEKGELRLLEPVQFETATAEIKSVSFELLDEVMEIMVERPRIGIAVHGHTDARGSEAYNQLLSQRRAAAVVKYLSDKGVALERLSAQGFGPTQPIATNDSAEGRAANRRVEFKIVEADGEDE